MSLNDEERRIMVEHESRKACAIRVTTTARLMQLSNWCNLS